MEKIDPSLRRQPADLPDRRRPWPRPRTSWALDAEDRAGLPEAVRRGDRSLTDRDAEAAEQHRDGAGADLTLRSGHQDVRRLHRGRRPRPDRAEQGSFFALLGPSGCGKTTTLRMVAGPGGADRAARSRIGGAGHQPAQALQAAGQHGVPELRAVPAPRHLRERRVRAAPPRRQGRQAAGRARCSSWSSSASFGQRRKPAQLSGGQQQRVALARALINRPQVLLLDEPLGALDLKLRRQMQIELKRIQTEVGITFVHVTHDQEEAMTMADTIAVMNDGRDRADGRARPSSTSARRPRSSPTSSASPTWSRPTVVGRDGDDLRASTRTAARLARARPRAPGVPRATVLGRRPAGEGLPRRGPAASAADGATVLAGGTVSDVSFIGVSTQYLVRMPWGQELMVFEQNTRRAGRLPRRRPRSTCTGTRRTRSCSTPTRTRTPATSRTPALTGSAAPA